MPAISSSAATMEEKSLLPSQPPAPNGMRAMAEEKDSQFIQPTVTPELVASHGLAPDEYQKIVNILGRPPNYTELGVFSVMWSEHCSYKSSRAYLKRLPTDGPYVLQGPGENAGV